MGYGKVGLDPLFLGLTRPALLFGVSFIFFGLNMMSTLIYFVATSDFKVILLTAGLHIFGMAITKKEPLAVEMLMLRIQKFNMCRNRNFYGGVNSYGVF